MHAVMFKGGFPSRKLRYILVEGFLMVVCNGKRYKEGWGV